MTIQTQVTTQPQVRQNDFVLHSDLTGLRQDIQETNRNVERIAHTLELMSSDHETRLRAVEVNMYGTRTLIELVKWIGPGALVSIAYLLLTQ